jgi:pyruvate,water dikinase
MRPKESYLNIRGKKNVLVVLTKCFACCLPTGHSIQNRNGFFPMQGGLSAGVQKMVRSDLAASGVMFSCDTESGFGDVVLINASYGLGENVVLGRVEPDQYYVFQTTLKKDFRPILEKHVGSKLIKMVYERPKIYQKITTTKKRKRKLCVKDDGIFSWQNMPDCGSSL